MAGIVLFKESLKHLAESCNILKCESQICGLKMSILDISGYISVTDSVFLGIQILFQLEDFAGFVLPGLDARLSA